MKTNLTITDDNKLYITRALLENVLTFSDIFWKSRSIKNKVFYTFTTSRGSIVVRFVDDVLDYISIVK